MYTGQGEEGIRGKKYRMVDNMFEKRLLLSLIAPRQKSFKTGVNERVSIRILGGIGGCRGSTPGVFCRNIYVYIYIFTPPSLYCTLIVQGTTLTL